MPVRSIISGAFLAMGFGAATVVAAPQTNIAGGVFVEAEHYDGWPWYSEAGFGQRQEDEAASGHAVLAGMWKKGALYYTLTARSPGEYNVWMRCAVPGKAQVRFRRQYSEGRAVAIRDASSDDYEGESDWRGRLRMAKTRPDTCQSGRKQACSRARRSATGLFLPDAIGRGSALTK